MIEFIHDARTKAGGVIINAGAYTRTSIEICDALKILNVPIIEIHISNIHQREEFRSPLLYLPRGKRRDRRLRNTRISAWPTAHGALAWKRQDVSGRFGPYRGAGAVDAARNA